MWKCGTCSSKGRDCGNVVAFSERTFINGLLIFIAKLLASLEFEGKELTKTVKLMVVEKAEKWPGKNGQVVMCEKIKTDCH